MGYQPALQNKKTTIKTSSTFEDCHMSEYDNIFFKSSKVKMISSGIIPFYKSFSDLKAANAISDHLPIYFKFYLN